MVMLFNLTTVFGAVFALVLYIFQSIEREKMKIKERVTNVVGPEEPVPIRQRELSFSLYTRFIRPLLSSIFGVLIKYIPAFNEEVLAKRLNEAGNPYNLLPREVMVIKYLLSCLVAFCVRLLMQGSGSSGPQTFVMIIAGIAFGWLLPDLFINSMIRQRKEQVCKELPEILDLLTVCIEAGLGFDGALKKVVEKSKGVLADELYIVLQEISMGKPRKNALRDMADRLAVDDFSNFVGSIIMAEQLGISIGNVMRLQARDVRQKRRQRVEEQAMKAPVKMLVPMVFFVFPAIFIVLLGPAIIQIMRVFAK
ncbi:type II secretion system F family protein [Tepidanaerobacter sp. GT38]|uniref:type II secretion system F family protein n=1 Tax=Tepidanaerobacter sp. GT38 TaxID=2722793 RepID=UPI001F3C2D44|nr:type II secretion system F family protein [Tepidanaerobacter sp. GT38]MCG1011533.1 type II secretion system F family protein [Tepidanaerobacter sp. GT38]